MATITGRAKITMTVILELDEREARALEAMSGYTPEKVVEVFKQHMGSHYIRGNEEGFVSLMKTARGALPPFLKRVDAARLAFAKKGE